MQHRKPTTRLRLTRRGKVVLGLLLALLIAAPVQALAGSNTVVVPASITADQSPYRAQGNCSGTLGDWTVLTHANFGDLTDTDGDPQADVVIVGDSLTTGSVTEQIAWFAARGKTLAGNYWSGRPAAPAVDWALSLTTKPKVLVFADLTNDLFDPAGVTAQLTRLKTWANTAPVTRLIVVDVFSQAPATAACDLRNAGWINNQARDVIGPGGVCSWWNGFAQDPNRIGNYLKPDGRHPIEGVGTNYRAAVVGNCVY